MKLGFCLPRYGEEVHGGAEMAARLLAEHVVALAGWDCDVFTTTAVDASTWDPYFQPGTTELNGVTVHRFAHTPRERKVFSEIGKKIEFDPSSVTAEEAEIWLTAQGPTSGELLDAALISDCELMTMHPYLFWPTVKGVKAFGPRAVVHPAVHDEPFIYLPPFVEVFRDAGAFVYWTEEERSVAERLFSASVSKPGLVLGFGVDSYTGQTKEPSTIAQIGNQPYLLCLGKVMSLKGTTVLAQFFEQWKKTTDSPLKLVFAGPIETPIEDHPDIIVLGSVDEPTKWGLLKNAVAMVSPSGYESLSLVALEAFSVKTPVIVNGLCATTKGHCERSNGGLWYSDYFSFAAICDTLKNEDMWSAMGIAGQAYLSKNFRWELVVARYCSFLERHALRVNRPREVVSAL